MEKSKGGKQQDQHPITFNSPYLLISPNGKIEGAGPRKTGVKLLMDCTAGNGTKGVHAPMHEIPT